MLIMVACVCTVLRLYKEYSWILQFTVVCVHILYWHTWTGHVPHANVKLAHLKFEGHSMYQFKPDSLPLCIHPIMVSIELVIHMILLFVVVHSQPVPAPPPPHTDSVQCACCVRILHFQCVILWRRVGEGNQPYLWIRTSTNYNLYM